LRAADGRLLRVSWDEPGADRKRHVAPGRYELLGYRLMAEAEGTTWHVSSSGLRAVSMDFSPGGTHLVSIDPTILLEERVQSDGLQVAVRGHENGGLSIYKEGKRVPIGYRRVDRAGTLLGEGKIEYG
jgi:hypothetical protein